MQHVQVILYTRQGCHLCAEALQRLQKARKRYLFAFSEVDIDGDPELQREYGNVVPVVTLNGKIRFRGVVNDVLLARLLNSEARRNSSSDGLFIL